ncbi:hypothetical protein ACQ9LF_06205 [Anaerohalosphaeraceae bacterium U12dextr]|jgi:hypothetical protein
MKKEEPKKGRIEYLLYPAVWSRGKYYGNMWDIKTALSAGIAALDMLTAEQREQAVAVAKGETMSVRYELLNAKEQQLLDEFRKSVAADAADAQAVIASASAPAAALPGKKAGKSPKSA